MYSVGNRMNRVATRCCGTHMRVASGGQPGKQSYIWKRNKQTYKVVYVDVYLYVCNFRWQYSNIGRNSIAERWFTVA